MKNFHSLLFIVTNLAVDNIIKSRIINGLSTQQLKNFIIPSNLRGRHNLKTVRFSQFFTMLINVKLSFPAVPPFSFLLKQFKNSLFLDN